MNTATEIILVGSNPSEASPDNSAFHPSTKSRKFIDRIFAGSGYHITYMNLIDRKVDNNKAISNSEIKHNLDQIKEKFELRLSSKIVALGKTASDGLRLAGINHFALPHPSGLCRFWNDPAAAEVKIREMFLWIDT